MVDVNQKIVDGLEKIGLPWPGGNSETLQSIASRWDTLADALTTEVGHLNSLVDGVNAQEWSGDAHDAFVKQWNGQAQQIQQAAANFHQVADGLRQYATEIESINEEIVSIVEQILAATAIGAVLTVLTAGISDAVSAAADAAEIARIVALIARFTEWAERIGQTLKDALGMSDEVAEVLGKLAETVGKMTKTFTTNFVADSGSTMISQGLSGQTVTAGADLRNGALDAAGTTFTDGLLSHVPGVKTVLSGDASPVLNGTLSNMGGAMFEDGVNDAEAPGSVTTTQWIEDLVTSGATGLAGSAIGKGIANYGKTADAGDDAGSEPGDASEGGDSDAGDGESVAIDAGGEAGIELQSLGPHTEADGSDAGDDSASQSGESSVSEDSGAAGDSGDSSDDSASFVTASVGSDAASFHTAPEPDSASDAGSLPDGTGSDAASVGSTDSADSGDSGTGDSGSSDGGTADNGSSDSASFHTAPEPEPEPGGGGFGPGKVTAMTTGANLGVYTVGAVIEDGIQKITGQAQSASQILASLENNGGPMPGIGTPEQ